MGVTEQQLRELGGYEISEAFDHVERAALDLAVAMAKTPTEIPSELSERLRKHFEEAQLVELASTIAWEHYQARFNRVFGVRSSGFSEGAFCALPRNLRPGDDRQERSNYLRAEAATERTRGLTFVAELDIRATPATRPRHRRTSA
jgi:hypothetical protein